METIEVQVTKLFKILCERGMTPRDLSELIKNTDTNGKGVPVYILNGMVNGKRKNFTVETAKRVSRALNVTVDEILD